LAALLEEVFEQGGGFVGHEGGDDGESVVEPGVVAELVERSDAAGLGVVGGVDESVDACVDERAGAHGAGLEGDGHGVAGESPGVEPGGGGAEGGDLGVGGGVVVELASVVAGGEGRDVEGGVFGRVRVDDGGDGDFAEGGGVGGEVEGVAHHGAVEVGGFGDERRGLGRGHGRRVVR